MHILKRNANYIFQNKQKNDTDFQNAANRDSCQLNKKTLKNAHDPF